MLQGNRAKINRVKRDLPVCDFR